MTPLFVLLLIVLGAAGLLFAASNLRWINATAAARILVGIPTALIAAIDAYIGFRVGLPSAVIVQVPTVLFLLALLPTLRPTGILILLQVVSFALLALVGLLAILSVGVIYLLADLFLFFGMLCTASAASDNDRHNESYWRNHLSPHA